MKPLEKPYLNVFDPGAEYYFAEGCFINELANSENDAAVSVAMARVEVGQTTRWHRLVDISERYVLLEGEGIVEVEGLDATRVGRGDVVAIPPGARQRITCTGEGDLVFLAICSPRFDPGAYRDAEDAGA